jgi:hypothetical protein
MMEQDWMGSMNPIVVNDLLRDALTEIDRLRSLNTRYSEALEKLSKGNRSPGVLKIAREALEGE